MEPVVVATRPYALGAIKSAKDENFNPHSYPCVEDVYMAVKAKNLPRASNLKRFDVRDQGPDGACVAFATNLIAAQLEWNDIGRIDEDLAPRFTYELRKDPSQEGMLLSNAMEIVQQYGVVPESMVPYKSKAKISRGAFIEGRNHRMGTAAMVYTLDGLKKSMIERKAGAIIAFKVYNFGNYFWRQEDPSQESQGRHCVAIVDYVDPIKDERGNILEDGYLVIQNSWGSDWGEQGRTKYSYKEFLEGHHFEVWTFVDIKGSKPFNTNKKQARAGAVRPQPLAKIANVFKKIFKRH